MAARPTVHAGFGTPAPQNRWKVGFRLILAVPHFFVLLFYGVGALVTLVVGWFGALFTGRLPQSIARYQAAFILYTTRLYAYANLMLDRYPPFSLFETGPYPVNVEIEVGDVRRVAVLFRIILIIPAQFLNTLVTEGMGVAAFFIWLIVLVAGRMPTTIFGAVSAVLRFQARTSAYVAMLTGKYPGELFGDQSLYGDPAGPQWGVPSVPPAPPGVSAPPPAYMPNVPAPAPSEPVPPPPPGPPPGAPPPFAGPGGPTVGRLVLSKASKRLLVLFIVLGLVAYAAQIAADNNFSKNGVARTAVTNAYDTLQSQLHAADNMGSTCSESDLQCQADAESQVADAFAAFGQTLRSTSFPSWLGGEVANLERDTDQLVSALEQPPANASISQAVSQPEVQALDSQWTIDFEALDSSLH